MAYDYSQYGGVLVERRDKVLTITLNAPETLNAFTGEAAIGAVRRAA
jgi:enoyl-CoA hydratase